MKKIQVFAFVFLIAFLATAGLADITVVGTDTYPNDVNNVQAAVMNPNTIVYLDGIFNFGETGRVVISVEGVTLQGVSTGATIRGGYYPIGTFAFGGPAISTAKNITIRNIRFEGWLGFAIYHMGVAAEDNFTLIEGNTFVNTMWPTVYNPDLEDDYGPGVHYCTGGGSAEIKNNTFIDSSYLAISTHALTLHSDDHLLIEGNKLIDCHYDPIDVGVWNRSVGDVGNGPVVIRNNEISISPEVLDPYVYVIDLDAWWWNYASNAVIEGNVITGNALFGIVVFPYGHDRKIINNDLSGLTTFDMQISTFGREDVIANNVLGPVDTSGVYDWPIFATGVGMFAMNPYPGVWPDAETVMKNVSTGNDFRRTGLKGWAFDDSGNLTSNGCVLLASWVDLGLNEWWPGCEVTNNLVKETGRFPRGVGGPKLQVLEIPVYAHLNRIVGQAANEYARFGGAKPGIGQMLLKKQAFIKELRKAIEE